MEAYLRTCGVTKSVRNRIWEHKNQKSESQTKKRARTRVETNESETEITDGYDPITDESGYVPKLWRSRLRLVSYLACAMHLIFHGVLATIVERFEKIIADHGLTRKFEKTINPYLQDIMSYRLEWCKIKTLPKNSGRRNTNLVWQE